MIRRVVQKTGLNGFSPACRVLEFSLYYLLSKEIIAMKINERAIW
jgi:hypothetical protein